jgi:hypothetical protein
MRHKIIFLLISWVLIFSLIGCEAFVRKFTRKPKKAEWEKEEMVLAPEEYKGPQIPKDQLYRENLRIWQAWQDELLTCLAPDLNYKKQVDCAIQAIKSLVTLRGLLNQEGQKKLDVYIGELTDLKNSIAGDLYGSNVYRHRARAERLKRNILRDFTYDKIKDKLA